MRDQGIIASAQFDPSKLGVGTSPFVGDLGSTGIRVPAFATTQQNRRYLFRLASVKVPAGTICLIRSLHQLLYIGAEVAAEAGAEDEKWRFEVPVTDPTWCFPDGNVSWHLRSSSFGTPLAQIFPDLLFPPDTSARGDTTDSALLATAPATFPGNYRPLNGGLPHGITACPGLDTWRDMRYPWRQDCASNLNIEVRGPTHLAMYASVYQTDPDNRPNKPVLIETAGLVQEDLFMLNFPTARYTRIGGRIMFDLIEDCEKR